MVSIGWQGHVAWNMWPQEFMVLGRGGVWVGGCLLEVFMSAVGVVWMRPIQAVSGRMYVLTARTMRHADHVLALGGNPGCLGG